MADIDASDIETLTGRLWVDHRYNRERSIQWQKWALGKQDLPAIPDTAQDEYKALQEKAITPWLGLLVQSLAQALIVEGYRPTAAEDDNMLWSAWQANRMDAKQIGVYDAAFTTGVSYVAVLPTDSPRARHRPTVQGALPVPEWRPYSSAEMTAFYEGPHDEWPAYALAAERAPVWGQPQDGRTRWRLTLFDDRFVYILDMTEGSTPALVDEPRPHGYDTAPVVAFTNRKTVTGRVVGEVEPYVAVASRIDQDVFDRLIVQRYGSWRVRWATGLMLPASDEEANKVIKELLASDIITNDSPDGRFGSIPETPLDGHLRAPIEDVRMLAAVSQTPPTVLTGDLTNISAEALAAVEAAYNRKVEQRKLSFGESWEKVFDITAEMMDMEADHSAQVRWRDMESRSMAQTADAFGKLAQMLEIPVEVLWDKIGFLTDQDRQRAREIRSQGGFDELLRELSRGQTSPAELDAV